MRREQSAFKRGGFFSVEALLAVAIFALLVTALVGAYLYGQESTVFSGNHARATMLAEEGLEAVRNIRDENFFNLTDGTHGLTISGNQWILSGSSDASGIFTRQISISSIDAERRQISSSVSWHYEPFV